LDQSIIDRPGLRKLRWIIRVFIRWRTLPEETIRGPDTKHRRHIPAKAGIPLDHFRGNDRSSGCPWIFRRHEPATR
jgi:hypothetical protein